MCPGWGRREEGVTGGLVVKAVCFLHRGSPIRSPLCLNVSSPLTRAVVHIQCSKLFKCLECAVLYMVADFALQRTL